MLWLAALLGGCGSATERNLQIGIDTAQGFYDMPAIVTFERAIGRHVEIVQNFVPWRDPENPILSEFPTTRVEQVLNAGSEPEITWDPTSAEAGSRADLTFGQIASGDDDAYVRRFAAAAAAVRRPILIRFAHEMNGSWTSYYVGNGGNRPGDFIRAWRHVHEVFEIAGATNVKWVWSPNVDPAGERTFAELYPGNAYVDWVGLDGYSYPKAMCKTPAATFGPALREVEHVSDRPVMLAEVGIAALCPDKPTLIRKLFSWLVAHPRIRSITWWERDEAGEDWNVTSSPAALKAFRVGLRG